MQLSKSVEYLRAKRPAKAGETRNGRTEEVVDVGHSRR